ncbi:MAG: RHS repeat-associated core domain-containing protein [Caldilineaceae bacterium]
MRSAGTLYWLLGDHLGSTAVSCQRYHRNRRHPLLPWGSERFTSGSTPTSFKYTGQRQESAIGLYYYGVRWYDPALGRFVQPDTIVPDPGEAKSFDRYAYVLNNPLRYTDPTGHYSPVELMEHFGCDNLQCVTDHFGPNGDYAGQWGWFTILTQAQDGDQILAHSISSALNGAQLDSEFVGTFARVNGKIMIRVASTSDSNAATGERQTTRFDPDSLVAEKAAAAYGNLGSFGWYQLTGHKSVYASPQDKSVNCHYDDCVSLAIDGAADAVSAVAVGCAAAGQFECTGAAIFTGRILAVGSVLYTGAQTYLGNSTGADLTVSVTTSTVSFFDPFGVGIVAGEVQTLYDYNALRRKPE